MWAAVARATAGDLARRRTALVLLVSLPFVTYATTSSPLYLTLVTGWAVATLSLFSWVYARGIERRLAIVGARPVVLFASRAITLAGVFVLLGAVGCAVVAYGERDAARPWALVTSVAVACLLGVPLGGLVGQLLPREMEATLLLMVVMATQFAVAGTAQDWSRALPLDGPVRLVQYGIVGPAPASELTAALTQCLSATLVLTGAAVAVALGRLRPHGVARRAS